MRKLTNAFGFSHSKKLRRTHKTVVPRREVIAFNNLVPKGTPRHFCWFYQLEASHQVLFTFEGRRSHRMWTACGSAIRDCLRDSTVDERPALQGRNNLNMEKEGCCPCKCRVCASLKQVPSRGSFLLWLQGKKNCVFSCTYNCFQCLRPKSELETGISFVLPTD